MFSVQTKVIYCKNISKLRENLSIFTWLIAQTNIHTDRQIFNSCMAMKLTIVPKWKGNLTNKGKKKSEHSFKCYHKIKEEIVQKSEKKLKNKLINRKIQDSGVHIQMSKNLQVKCGCSTWCHFLVTAHTHRHTHTILLYV